MKNILLTTIGYTKNRIDVEYFHFKDPNGVRTYCTGISVAEAGTKYILGNYPIDEIVVLGAPGAARPTDDTASSPLAERVLPQATELTDFSEYNFYCYRILQFLEGLDIEANDLYESLDEAQQTDVIEKWEQFKRSSAPGMIEKELFWRLDSKPESESDLQTLRASLTRDQWNWLKYSSYLKMDSYYKMHLLARNRDVSVRFLPLRKNSRGAFDLQNLNQIVSDLLTEANTGTNFYMDLQGMDFCDGYTFFNLLSMLHHGDDRRIGISSIIQSTGTLERLSAPILDEWSRLEMHELLTGVNVFINYGKVDYLQRYWDTHEFTSPAVEELLAGMKYVEEGISLCNIPVLKYGIAVIRQLLRRQTPEQSEDLVYKILASTIQKDYGKMLDGDEVQVAELLKWLLRKKMYQQALTIIESQVPDELVRRGIFYYARTQTDLENMMAMLNTAFWNEIPKCRYVFNDLSHYFIRNYGSDKVNFHQKKDAVSRDFVRLRVGALHEGSELLPAYSDLNNEDMLYELLLNYRNLCRLRNEVCHALPPETALGGGEELVPASNLAVLEQAIRKFTEIFTAACRRVPADAPKPLLIDQAEFRSYCRHNRLLPFEQTDQDTLDRTCICDYNGSQVTVRIQMLRPQDHYFDDE